MVSLLREEENAAVQGQQGDGSPFWEAEKHLYRPAQAVVVGHSFVRRLEEFLVDKYGPYHNFGLSYDSVHVHSIYKGGMTAESARYEYLHRIVDLKPDIVYLELGSNDICRRRPEQVGSALLDLTYDLQNLGVKYVVVGQTIFREGRGIPAGKPDYNRDVAILNNYTCAVLDPASSDDTKYWKHRGLWESKLRTLGRDGVHPNNLGLQRLYRSVRGAIMHAVGKVKRSLTSQ